MRLLLYSEFLGEDFTSPPWQHTKTSQWIAMKRYLGDTAMPNFYCGEIGPHSNFDLMKSVNCRHVAAIDPYNGSEGAGLQEVPTLPYPLALFRCALGETSEVIPDSLFDLTYSVSVMEHIGQYEAAYDCEPSSAPPEGQETKRNLFCEELFRITKPGGITAHTIDHAARNLSYHSNFIAAGFEPITPVEKFCTVQDALTLPDAVRQKVGWLGEREMPVSEQSLHAVLFATYRRP
jgi:hypothetical protein